MSTLRCSPYMITREFAQSISEALKNHEEFYSRVSYSDPGMVYISCSLDKTWFNGIFENSRYVRFVISEGKIEVLSKRFDMPKFRKKPAKDLDKVLSLVLDYLSSSADNQTIIDL
jgi:hypothetical protein